MTAGKLIFIGDVHLDRAGADLSAFLHFLDRLRATSSRVVLMGDLFNLWIGRAEMQQPYHREVLAKLAELQACGIVVRYIEGNRDYRVGPCWPGGPADVAGAEGLVERFGGRSLFAVHGDLTNVEDRQYRTWRRFSRAAPVWALFNLVPVGARRRLADALEARMRSTNMGFKREFPEARVREYASEFLDAGHDAVVLGHFHVERDLECPREGRPSARILVLPEWKSSQRHLEVSVTGEIRFVDS